MASAVFNKGYLLFIGYAITACAMLSSIPGVRWYLLPLSWFFHCGHQRWFRHFAHYEILNLQRYNGRVHISNHEHFCHPHKWEYLDHSKHFQLL